MSVAPLPEETVDQALDRLEMTALRVLEAQVGSKDERVAQRAAQLLLEWKRGKPMQPIKQDTTIKAIRYESVAWRPDRELEEISGGQTTDEGA